MSSPLSSLIGFVVILLMIPVALWVLKRTPMGGAQVGPLTGQMRAVGVLQLSPNQRILTVEVGQGEDRRWLVLGVTAQSITTLHTLPPQPEVAVTPVALNAGQAFAQLLGKFRQQGKGPGGET